MFKKFFSFFMFVFLSCSSFFLTSLSVDYIKSLDPIMILIKDDKSNYEVAAVDAIIDDEVVIPGKRGIEVDVDSSFELMKKYGSYDEKLLVFDEVIPSISISDIYNKYILSGNPNNNAVTFVFKVDNTSFIEEIVSILKKKNIVGTFFISDEILRNNTDIVKLLISNNQEIESLGNNGYDLLELENINDYINSFVSKDISYCYSDSFNKAILEVCSKMNMHTIVPSINTFKNPYYEIKDGLSNGKIIKFNNNSKVIYELNFIINYIRQNNYEIISLRKMLEE